MKKLLKLISLMVLLLFIAGCGGKNEHSSNQITVAVSGDVLNWDLSMFPDGDTRFIWSQVYETLVRLDTDLKEQPGLALSWESSGEGKVWTFKLRQGVKFHDGSPFNAAAVKYSYSERADVIKRKMIPLVEIQTPDDYTVKFILSRPVPLPSYLTHVAWPVMSPASVNSGGKFIGPSGTGPYKLEKHVKDQQIILVRNDEYWGEKGTLDRVVFSVIPDASARIMALQSGQVDMAIKLSEADAVRVSSDPNIKVHRKLSTFTDFMQFNCKKPPLDDVRVRQAIALAVDSEMIVKELLGGIGVPAMGRPLSPVMKFSNPDLKISPDRHKSKELLSQAGWKDSNGDGIVEKNGTPLVIASLLAPWSPRQKIEAEAVQGLLKEVGIDMQLQTMESGAITAAENQGNFDVLLRSGYFTWGDYPHHLKMHTSKNMYSHWENPEYDSLVARGESAALDEKAKAAIYDSAQRILLDQVPAVYLVHEEKVVATRSRIKNYRITAEDPWLNLAGISIEE